MDLPNLDTLQVFENISVWIIYKCCGGFFLNDYVTQFTLHLILFILVLTQNFGPFLVV